MSVNVTWHEENPLPERPCRMVRVLWHARHALACGCRSVPSSIREDVEAEPAQMRVEVQLRRPGRRMPGAQQVRGIADHERRVAGAHETLRGGRRSPREDRTAAGLEEVAAAAGAALRRPSGHRSIAHPVQPIR